MKNKERTIVYSLLAVSIFLGLTRPLGSVVADNPPGEATFEKLTIVGGDGSPAIVLDTQDGGARMVLSRADGNPAILVLVGEDTAAVMTLGPDKNDRAGFATTWGGRSGLQVRGAEGKGCVRVEANEEGECAILGQFPTGERAFELLANKDAVSKVSVLSRGREGGAGLVAGKEGMRWLGTFGSADETAARLYTTPDGASRMVTYFPGGKPAVWVNTEKEGIAGVATYGPDGSVTGHLP